MLLNSVILVLQETLEAALLISVLLAISHHYQRRAYWLLYAIVIGLVFSLFYAVKMAQVSEWFEYTGQEVINALLQTSTTLFIMVCTWLLMRYWVAGSHKVAAYYASRFRFFAAITVLLAITREGSEVLIYLLGFYQQNAIFHIMTIGSLIGFGIGVSVGVLILYGLLSLQGRWRIITTVSVLALFAGNMLSQATLQLIQSDWISSAHTIWDSSGVLSEDSLAGKLLYALVGYEATPSGVQVVAYGTGIILVLLTGVLAYRVPRSNISTQT